MEEIKLILNEILEKQVKIIHVQNVLNEQTLLEPTKRLEIVSRLNKEINSLNYEIEKLLFMI